MRSSRHTIPLILICMATLFAVSACASAQYYNNEFQGDPLQYLVGEWEGMVDIPGPVQPNERVLVIPSQPSGSMLYGYYGVETTRLSKKSISVEQINGTITIRLFTGLATASLQLNRMGNVLILRGLLKSANLPNQMLLTKKK